MKKKIYEEVYYDTKNLDTEQNLPEVTGKYGSPMVDISTSPDGKYVVGVDGRVHLWDYSSGRKIRTFFSPSRLTSVSFSKDSKYIVTGNVNGNLQVWDVETGKIHRNFLTS
jgi:WD40 repeat protein